MIGFNALGYLGRLGNQMFQFAALKGIARNRGFNYCLPPSDLYAENSNVEQYDGVSWTEVANVSSARSYCSATGSGAGTVGNTTALFFGGATTSSTPNTTATEEWNIPTSYTIKTFTAS